MSNYALTGPEAVTAWHDAEWRDVDRWRLADQMARNGMGKLPRKASLLSRSALSD